MATGTRLLATIACFLAFCLLSRAQDTDQEPKFTYPAEDDKLEFYDNAQVIVAYECPVETVTLRVYCQDESRDYVHQGESGESLFSLYIYIYICILKLLSCC